MSGLGSSVGRWLFRGIESGDAQTHPMASPLNALADPDAEASANVPEVTWICFTATADRYILGVEAMVLLTHGTFATRTHRTVLVAVAMAYICAISRAHRFSTKDSGAKRPRHFARAFALSPLTITFIIPPIANPR